MPKANQYFLPMNIPVLGIEPAVNVAQFAIAKGVSTLTEFFGTKLATELAAQGKRPEQGTARVLHHGNGRACLVVRVPPPAGA